MPVFSFLLCNLGICLIIGMILAIRHIFRNQLSSRTQYHLWFLLLGLLAVPFLPLKFSGWPLLLSRLNAARLPSSSGMGQTSCPAPGKSDGEKPVPPMS